MTMMIEVEALTKRYAGRTAVDDISFTVAAGEIVGVLGPNGAGKSTTLRMLAGFLPPTAGTARIAGFDIVRESRETRRRIGYLPEQCPLYTELRVDEYLRFRAGLKGVPSHQVAPRVEEVKELCGLSDTGTRIIGQLSKGYRQRVGLADSLVHDPEVLILDEPTIGLDPHQLRHIRALLQDLARRHTILISSHILSEIEMTCRRVLILHGGRIVAAETPHDLQLRLQRGETVHAELRGPDEAIRSTLAAIPGVTSLDLTSLGDGWMACALHSGEDVREAVAATAARHDWGLRELRRNRRTLEEVFVELTSNPQGGTS